MLRVNTEKRVVQFTRSIVKSIGEPDIKGRISRDIGKVREEGCEPAFVVLS